MDNKITKKRVSEFIGYEIVILVALLLVALFVFEFLYGWIATQPTTGQYFKFYYDENIYGGNYEQLLNEFKKDDTFSYDIIRLEGEECVEGTNVLRHRYAIQEADFIITDYLLSEEGRNNVESYVDEFSIYSYNDLYNDAVEYLSSFLKDEYSNLQGEDREKAVYSYDNLDQSKIEEHFNIRMKKDNRFRWNKDKKAEGLLLEYQRFKKLCKGVEEFKIVLVKGEEIGLFYKYTKYKQASINPEYERDREDYQKYYANQVALGRVDLNYAIKCEKLTGGKIDSSEFFKIKGNQTAKDTAILTFNFLKYQPDLQFETIFAINTMVRLTSDI